MIVKNEAVSIRDTIRSVKGIVDRYCILDTGSTDDTISIIKEEFKETPGNVYEEPFVDFATTRNRVLELAGTECKYTLMLSGDEYLRNGEQLKYYLQNTKSNPSAIELKVHYGQTNYNSIRVCNTSEKWVYVGVTHEYVTSLSPKTTTYVMPYSNDRDVYILHDLSHFDREKKKKRWELDVALLKEDHINNPSNTRTVFYLAQSYDCLDLLEEAFYYYNLRYEMGGWYEERYESLYRMADILVRMGLDWSISEIQYLKAYNFLPSRAEPLYAIAKYWYDQKQYDIAYIFISRAYQIEFPTEIRLFINPSIYNYYIPELLSHVCMHVKSKGLEQMGLEATEKCLQQYPNHADLKKNLRFFQNRIGKENSAHETKHVSLELPVNNRYYYHVK